MFKWSRLYMFKTKNKKNNHIFKIKKQIMCLQKENGLVNFQIFKKPFVFKVSNSKFSKCHNFKINKINKIKLSCFHFFYYHVFQMSKQQWKTTKFKMFKNSKRTIIVQDSKICNFQTFKISKSQFHFSKFQMFKTHMLKHSVFHLLTKNQQFNKQRFVV